MDGQLESGGDGFDSGRQSSTSHRTISRMTGSRPGSVLDGRPGSSMRKGRRDIEHRERTKKMGNTEVHTFKKHTLYFHLKCNRTAILQLCSWAFPPSQNKICREGPRTRLSCRTEQWSFYRAVLSKTGKRHKGFYKLMTHSVTSYRRVG